MLGCFQSSPITRRNKYPYVCDLQGLAHVSGKFPEMELVVQREHPLKVCIRSCKNKLYRPCTNLCLYSQFQRLSPLRPPSQGQPSLKKLSVERLKAKRKVPPAFWGYLFLPRTIFKCLSDRYKSFLSGDQLYLLYHVAIKPRKAYVVLICCVL